MNTNNQGRKPKPIAGDPLAAFFMKHFRRFAWDWRHPADLKRLAIDAAPNEWPLVGNPELLHALFRLAAFPAELNVKGEHAELILVSLKRSPDFVLGLLVELRKQLARCKPHKQAMLLEGATGKFSSAEKTERYALRKLTAETTADHKEAANLVDQQFERSHPERYETQIFSAEYSKPPKSRRKARVQ